MINKIKIFKVFISSLIGLNFLVLNGGHLCSDSGAVGVAVEASGAVDEKKIEKFRNNLLRYFKLTHGREVDFNKRNEAQKLYEAIKKFESETHDVSPENLEAKFAEYIKNIRKSEATIEVLDKKDFDERLKGGSSFVRLFSYDFFYSQNFIDKLRNCEVLTNSEKVLNNAMQNYDNCCLEATNCREVVDHSFQCAGPWLLWVCSEFAIDLDKVNVLDSSHLEELVTILKYDHPQEFGFSEEIANNFNEDYYKNRYDSFTNFDVEQREKMFLGEYFTVPQCLFSNRAVHYDEFYRNKIGESYFDIIFKRVDEKKEAEIKEKIKPFEKELEDYDRSLGLVCVEGDDFDVKNKLFYVNKTYAILKNEEFLTKLLGYDVLFCKYNISEGEISEWNIAPNPRNGDYKIVDYSCLAFACSNEETKERPANSETVAESYKPVKKN